MVKNPPCNAKDTGSIPGPGRSHIVQACTLEPASHNYCTHVPQLLKPEHQEPVLCNNRIHGNEKPHAETESSPHSLQLEKAVCSNTDPAQSKK